MVLSLLTQTRSRVMSTHTHVPLPPENSEPPQWPPLLPWPGEPQGRENSCFCFCLNLLKGYPSSDHDYGLNAECAASLYPSISNGYEPQPPGELAVRAARRRRPIWRVLYFRIIPSF